MRIVRAIELRTVTPGYFSALGIPLRSGRNLTIGDGLLDPGVLLVNETLARLHFPGEDPVGRATDRGTIVGVVGDVRQAGLNRPVEPEIYKVINRDAGVASDLGMTLVVRTDGPPEEIVPAVRAAVRDVNPVVALFNIKTMAQVVCGFALGAQPVSLADRSLRRAGARARRDRVVRRHFVRRDVTHAGVRRAAGTRIRSRRASRGWCCSERTAAGRCRPRVSALPAPLAVVPLLRRVSSLFAPDAATFAVIVALLLADRARRLPRARAPRRARQSRDRAAA